MQGKRDVDRVTVVSSGPPTRMLKVGGGVILSDRQADSSRCLARKDGAVGPYVDHCVDPYVIHTNGHIEMIGLHRKTVSQICRGARRTVIETCDRSLI